MTFDQFPAGDQFAGHNFYSTVAAMVADSAGMADGEQNHTGGRITQGDGGEGSYTYNETGRPTADGGFAIDGNGADDYFSLNNQTVANLAQFGALGDDDGTGTTGADDTAAIQAAINSGAKYVRSHWDGKHYRITTPIEMWSTHDGMVVDFGSDWIDADVSTFVGNSMWQVFSGGENYTTPGAHVAFTIDIRKLQLDGHWDYAAFAVEINSQYMAASVNDTVEIDSATLLGIVSSELANTIYGATRYNGLAFVLVAAGTGKDLAYHTDHVIGDVTVRNMGKSGVAFTNPERMSVGSIRSLGCGIHGIVGSWDALEADCSPGQGTISIDSLFVEGAESTFDFSTTVLASKTDYDPSKLATANISSATSRNIHGRTKIHGPWNMSIDSMACKDPPEINKYAVLDVPATACRMVSIGSLECSRYTAGVKVAVAYTEPTIATVGTLVARNQNLINVIGVQSRILGSVPPNVIKVDTLRTDNCALITKGCVSVDHVESQLNIDAPVYWNSDSVSYPFDLSCQSSIKSGIIKDMGFGDQIPSYLFFIRTAGVNVANIEVSSSVSEGTLLAWEAATQVEVDEYRYFQASAGSAPELWQSNSQRTTGGTWDDTERDFWTAIANTGNGGDGRVRRLAYIDNTFDGVCSIKHCNLAGVWDRDFAFTDTGRFSLLTDSITNIRFTDFFPVAIPTSGTYTLPAKFYYPKPVAGGKMGAVLVTAGTPGTWKEFGPIDA